MFRDFIVAERYASLSHIWAQFDIFLGLLPSPSSSSSSSEKPKLAYLEVDRRVEEMPAYESNPPRRQKQRKTPKKYFVFVL